MQTATTVDQLKGPSADVLRIYDHIIRTVDNLRSYTFSPIKDHIMLKNENSFTRQSLIQSLKEYHTPFREEMIFRDQFLELLQHARCYHRDFLPGHITASAWITDPSGEHVLLTHHAKLNRWLQPGGHADGDENVLHVALREVEEETGLKNIRSSSTIFDIDIHLIPARGVHSEHYHYDIRFAFRADLHTPLHITHESNDLKWVALRELELFTDNRSILRMKEKGRAINP